MHNVWYISLVHRFNIIINIYCENFEKSIFKIETNKKNIDRDLFIINYKQFILLNKIKYLCVRLVSFNA